MFIWAQYIITDVNNSLLALKVATRTLPYACYHDLRTNLNVVLTFTSIIMSQTEKQYGHRAYLEQSERNARWFV